MVSLADGEVISHLDENGHEVLDGTPMSPPVGYIKQPSLAEQIRQGVRDYRLMQQLAADEDVESFEEADDFDVGDDVEVNSPWEEQFDPEGRSSFTPLSEVTRQEAAANEKIKAKKAADAAAATPPQPSPAQPATEAPRADNLSSPKGEGK